MERLGYSSMIRLARIAENDRLEMFLGKHVEVAHIDCRNNAKDGFPVEVSEAVTTKVVGTKSPHR